MRPLTLALTVVLLLTGSSCSRDPQVVAKKYTQNGNKYFEQGKYREARIMYLNALKKYAKEHEAHYRLGLIAMEQQDIPNAVRSFQRAIDGNPAAATALQTEAREKLGSVYVTAYTLRSQGYENLPPLIETIAAELRQKDANSPVAYRFEGSLAWLRDRDVKRAIDLFRKADAVKPLERETVLPLAELLFSDRQFAEGEKLLNALIEKNKTEAAPYQLLYAAYFRANRLENAERILQRRIQNNPKSAEAVADLAGFYFSVKRDADMRKTLEILRGNPVDFPSGRLHAGDFLARINELDAAVREYEEGIKVDGQRKAEYQKRIAFVLARQNKGQEAAQVLENLVAANPGDIDAAGMLSSLRIASQNPKEVEDAIRDLRALAARKPQEPHVRYQLGRALVAKTPPELSEAQTQFEEALRLPGADTLVKLSAQLAIAKVLFAKRDFNGALTRCAELLKADPASVDARLVRAAALVQIGSIDQARGELAEILKLRPNQPEAIMQLAGLDLGQNRFREAEEGFRKLYKPGLPDLRPALGLSELYARQNQFDRGLSVLTAELQKRPEEPRLLGAVANIEVRAGRYDAAIGHYKAALAKNPEAPALYILLAETYRRKRDTDSAIQHFRKAAQLAPDEVRAALPLALLLDGTGRKAEAKTVYEQVLKASPDQPVALNNLAYMLADSGENLDQALAYAQRAKQKWPNDPNVSDTLGLIYIKKDLTPEAVRIFRELIARDPENPVYRYRLGLALNNARDFTAAKRELQTALQKKPAKEDESKIRELLSKIG